MKNWQKGLSAGLSLALALGLLAGCGGGGGESDGGGGSSGGSGSGGSASGGNPQTEATGFVYVPEYIPIQGKFYSGLQNPVYCNGYIYARGTDRVPIAPGEEGEIPEDDGEVILFDAEDGDADADAGEADAVEPAVEPDGAVYDYGWNYETVLYKIGLDGSCEKIPYELTPTPQSEDENEYYGNYLQDIRVAGDGTVYALEQSYHQWSTAPEGVTPETDEDYYMKYMQYEENMTLQRLDPATGEQTAIDLTPVKEAAGNPDYFYVNSFAVDGEGNIYLASDSGFYILDSEGKLLASVPGGEYYIQSMTPIPGGKLLVLAYDYNVGHMLAYTLDPGATELGEGVQVSSDLYNPTPGGGDYDLYYSSGINFYGYNMETGEKEKVLNWLSCDVDPGYGLTPTVLEDGRIVAIVSSENNIAYARAYPSSASPSEEDYTVTNELVILTKTPAGQVAQKEVLTMACMYLDYNVRGQVVEFNKNSDRYRIEVQDYSEYNNYDSEDEADWNAGATKLRTEILSGKVPDLISVNGISISQFAAKGLLEDLYPCLDSDPELSRSDLMENVLKAFERDGKLYTTLSSFTVNTVMGAASLVGDTPGWTVDEFQAALAQMREMSPECTAFDKYITRSDILQQCLYQDMPRFVNWETGECNFDSDAFIKLLEFANSFPSEFDWENYEWTEEDDAYYRVSHGMQMLVNPSIYGFEVYDLRIYNYLLGGKGTFIGFPTEFGVGNTFYPAGTQFCMSSSCANKEAAWEFLRQFFTEKYQTNGDTWGFPTNAKAFRARMEQAMEPWYQTDYNGNYVLDENGNRIEQDYGTWGGEGYEVPGGPVTQAEADQILELINSTTKVLDYDENIYKIVEEGIEPYFAGQRSAQDVAKQIQSKVMIYVNEQR